MKMLKLGCGMLAVKKSVIPDPSEPLGQNMLKHKLQKILSL